MKFSKLLLIPLLGLSLVGCSTPDTSATSGAPTATDTTPAGPAWSKEDADKIKAVLGGNLIPLLEFSNGELRIEENSDGSKAVVYSISEPKEGDRVALLDKFVEDGFIIETDEAEQGSARFAPKKGGVPDTYAYKLLEKKHLGEALYLCVSEGVGTNGAAYLTARVEYECDTENNVWPAEEIAALCESDYISETIPAPEFEFTHISGISTTPGAMSFAYAIFFGDYSEAYAHTLAKNDYEVSLEVLEVPAEPAAEGEEPAEPEYMYIYLGHDDYGGADVAVHYEPELDATILEVMISAKEHWHNKVFAKAGELLGIEGLRLPEPYAKLVTYDYGVVPLGETEAEGYKLGIMGFTMDVYGASLYGEQLLNSGYVDGGKRLGAQNEPTWDAYQNYKTLAEVWYRYSYDAELGAIMMEIEVYLPKERTITEQEMQDANQALKDFTEMPEAELPTLPGKYTYITEPKTTYLDENNMPEQLLDSTGTPAMYFEFYGKEDNTALIEEALKTAGYVKEDTDQYLAYEHPTLNLRVEIERSTVITTLTRLMVSKVVKYTTWDEFLAPFNATSAVFTELIGADAEGKIPYPTEFEKASSFAGITEGLFDDSKPGEITSLLNYSMAGSSATDMSKTQAKLLELGWTETTPSAEFEGKLKTYAMSFEGANVTIVCDTTLFQGMTLGVYFMTIMPLE